MSNQNDSINHLLDKLEQLSRKQEDFSREINALRIAISNLKANTQTESIATQQVKEQISEQVTTEIPIVDAEQKVNINKIQYPSSTQIKPQPFNSFTPPSAPKTKSDIEKFIGENLINKIGIAITVIGVGIGAKYSIDNNLISPLTRIVIGYLFGLLLLGFGIKLKKNYLNFSAVLVSGAMAIMYFITYAAYTLYQLLPQIPAFIIMLFFTIFTVIASFNYNKQIIAIIALVGAYAVPFMLSNNSGNVTVLFTYMAILNLGILVIAFKKYWKQLFYTAFVLSWIIYLVWFISDYSTQVHFTKALLFQSIFFITFYITFLSYKLLNNEKFAATDILLVMANSFIYYGIGYDVLNGHIVAEQLLGLFTVANAVVHFIVSFIIHKRKLADKNLQYLITGIVLTFLTIAVPVQLNGNWVSLLWAGEATILFWIGRNKQLQFYERLAYPLMLLAFFSIVQDWNEVYTNYNPQLPATKIWPFINVYFLSSVLFIAAFVFINYQAIKVPIQGNLMLKNTFTRLMGFVIPAILIISIYFSFRLEISNYWHQLYADSALIIPSANKTYENYYWNNDLKQMKVIWNLNYSLFFVGLLLFVNLKKFKNRQLGNVSLGLLVVVILVYLIQGLLALSILRESFISQKMAKYYHIGALNWIIRYISYAFVAFLLIASYQYIKLMLTNKQWQINYDLLLHTTVLWIASSELIHWMDMLRAEQSYKLGLSILWGIYALFLIILGIWKKNQPLRIGAITLFSITLVKLFFYDISHLNTIAKTIVFVSLGLLLLIISFLYNKYKYLIANEEASDN